MAQIALVVDDSMLIRHTICRFLEEHGFVVECASDGREAIEALNRICPALIVTDMQMPGMSGAELITVLKSQVLTANIPVIIVTGSKAVTAQQETRANFIVHKDIGIREQLSVALKQLFEAGSSAQAFVAH